MTGRPEHDLCSTVVRSATEPQQNALVRLRKRREFIAVRKGQRAFCKGLIVQALPQRPAKGKEIRVGFTCSKKVGNNSNKLNLISNLDKQNEYTK